MTTAASGHRAIAYTRVSTGRQAESGLGLADQIERIREAVDARQWTLVHHAEDAGASGKSFSGRPALGTALDLLDEGKADVLIAAKLDRLSRSVVDFGTLIERAKRRGWSVVVLDADVDTTTPAGEFMANVMVSAAQYERRLIGQRTAAAHRVRRSRGQRAGQPPLLSAALRTEIADAVARGTSLRTIADRLNATGVPTAKGGRWHASTVRHVARSVSLDLDLNHDRGES